LVITYCMQLILLAIALAQFKCTLDELKDGIINMNADLLTLETTQALYVSVPTDEEVCTYM
jgi:hypothetical protein